MEEIIFNLADTHLFFNDLEVSIDKSVSRAQKSAFLPIGFIF